MNKLALSDEILLNIDKPARYIGHEVNAVMKDKEKVEVRFAMCFPDVYEIGMSHLGIQILYDMFNSWEDTRVSPRIIPRICVVPIFFVMDHTIPTGSRWKTASPISHRKL